MIFGHLVIAFLLKSKFYKKSLLLFMIFCFLPDIIFYILFGMQYVVTMEYSTLNYGLLRWILSLAGTEISFVEFAQPLSHSLVLYAIFLEIFLVYFFTRKRIISGLVYSGAILSHLLCDFLMLDHYWGVYLFYPFDPSLDHHLPYLGLDMYSQNAVFWLIDLLIFLVGFFVLLWAF